MLHFLLSYYGEDVSLRIHRRTGKSVPPHLRDICQTLAHRHPGNAGPEKLQVAQGRHLTLFGESLSLAFVPQVLQIEPRSAPGPIVYVEAPALRRRFTGDGDHRRRFTSVHCAGIREIRPNARTPTSRLKQFAGYRR
jgi:hypothetical protein